MDTWVKRQPHAKLVSSNIKRLKREARGHAYEPARNSVSRNVSKHCVATTLACPLARMARRL